MLLFSCNKEHLEDSNITLEPEIFQKYTKVSDSEGNSVEVEISASIKSLVEEFDVSSLELLTTTEVFEMNEVGVDISTQEETHTADAPTSNLDIICLLYTSPSPRDS